MNEIVKGALDGGWSLIVGWVLPSAVNLALAVLICSGVAGVPSIGDLADGDNAGRGAVALGVAVLGGLILAALQTPLYRLLEGYLGWPRWLFGRARRRMLHHKHLLTDRLAMCRLADAEREGGLDEAGRSALAALRAHPVVGRYAARDAGLSATQRALLRERLQRFPVDDDQVVATRLGNGIRRLEEYGYDRYRLDSQVLWYELSAVAPEQTAKQIDRSRTGVDFFVCLLFGHLIVAASAIGLLAAGVLPRSPARILAVPLLVVLAHVWYRIAVVATDDWAAAVRAMVNVGRGPLSEAMGLRLPDGIADEREMWTLASRLVRLPFDRRAAALDRFRNGPDPAQTIEAQAAGAEAREAAGEPS
ncbi:hypothetical protein GCM10023322_56350 [Rugosimonospora acidiphila]|uniref:DUF2207 domain-containing protein n=1 Tax=Rugosimonospora acidiphila TaxID=556531 RepID=A0ABP9SBD0_9ACTN